MKKVQGGVFVLLGCVLLAGCGVVSDLFVVRDPDVSGATYEAFELPLEEQYRLAGERYVATNEYLIDVQREISADGDWRGGTGWGDLIVGPGFSSARDVRGADRYETYYFSVLRVLYTEDNAAVLAEIERLWKARGWSVTVLSGAVTEDTRFVKATTPEGYYIVADTIHNGSVSVDIYSPVYWGDQRRISGATVERRDAEIAAGATWESRPEEGTSRVIWPLGEYRPFPAWDTIQEPTTEPSP